MKKIFLFAVITLSMNLFTAGLCAQTIPLDSMYFGQAPPAGTPKIFAPGIVSLPARKEPLITFSADGTEAFFYIEFYPALETPYVMYSKYADNHWSAPAQPLFAAGRLSAEPFLAFGGKRLYINASNAVNQQHEVDLSYVEKSNGVWGQPVSLGAPPNMEAYQYHSCVVADTSIYFSSNAGSIMKAQYKNGAYQAPAALPSIINSGNELQTWGDPYVAPDESYLIFKSTRAGGFGGNDIYISYRKPDLSWTYPKNLGPKINSSYEETSGDVTPDGKYMTFGRNDDLYWVSASFIDSLKHTNFKPYVMNLIPTQIISANNVFKYTIPDNVFMDDDGLNTLKFTAQLSSGNPLPAWLTFNDTTRTFKGTPVASGASTIRVTAIDSAGEVIAATFTIRVLPASDVERNNQTRPGGCVLGQNYPNPFNPSTRIAFTLPFADYVSLKVYDVSGREVRALINNELRSGENNVNFNAAGLSSGVYYYRLFTSSGVSGKSMIIMK